MRNQVALEQVKAVAYPILAARKYSLEEIADMTAFFLDGVKKIQAEQSA